jgi:hypothetical protein
MKAQFVKTSTKSSGFTPKVKILLKLHIQNQMLFHLHGHVSVDLGNIPVWCVTQTTGIVTICNMLVSLFILVPLNKEAIAISADWQILYNVCAWFQSLHSPNSGLPPATK